MIASVTGFVASLRPDGDLAARLARQGRRREARARDDVLVVDGDVGNRVVLARRMPGMYFDVSYFLKLALSALGQLLQGRVEALRRVEDVGVLLDALEDQVLGRVGRLQEGEVGVPGKTSPESVELSMLPSPDHVPKRLERDDRRPALGGAERAVLGARRRTPRAASPRCSTCR